MAKRKRDSFDIMAEAIAKHMRERGWEIMALVNMKVQRPLASLKYNYELVFKFTGKQLPKEKNV